jgi:hypothetical protein
MGSYQPAFLRRPPSNASLKTQVSSAQPSPGYRFFLLPRLLVLAFPSLGDDTHPAFLLGRLTL